MLGVGICKWLVVSISRDAVHVDKVTLNVTSIIQESALTLVHEVFSPTTGRILFFVMNNVGGIHGRGV